MQRNQTINMFPVGKLNTGHCHYHRKLTKEEILHRGRQLLFHGWP